MVFCPACQRPQATQNHLKMHLRRKELLLSKVLIFNRWEMVYVLPDAIEPKSGLPQKAKT